MSDFWLSGAAAIAAITIMHPVDVVKTKLQIQGELQTKPNVKPQYKGVFSALHQIAAKEGPVGLYRGLIPAYCLQFSVTATRFGIYGLLKDTSKDEHGNHKVQPARDFLLAAFAGLFSGIAGNPFYAIKTRAQAYSASSELSVGVHSQAKPLGVRDAVVDIYKTEGVRGYWRGLNAFAPRVIAYGAVQLSAYDSSKAMLINYFNLREGMALHASASFIAAGFAVTAIQPFDFVAARLMNQPVDPKTRKPLLYSGPLDCVRKSVQAEGVKSLFNGGMANYLRMGPYTVLVFIFFEQFKGIAARFRGSVNEVPR